MNPLSAWQKALASRDPLGKIRELIPDDGENERQVVVYAYACILETGSAGLSILFDRFDDDELHKIAFSLERIGATRTLGDLRGLIKVFQFSIANGLDRLDASELLAGQPDTLNIDQASGVHVQEMEHKLLEFCRGNIGTLAAGE